MAGPLDGRVALVTGGSRGIGRAIALELAGQGAAIAVNYHSNADAAQAVVAEIEQGGGRAVALQADIADADQSEAMVKQVVSELGALHILVNNAGTTADRTLMRMSRDEWRKVIATNVDGLYNVTQPAWSLMADAGGGHVICITSIVGQTGRIGLVNYATSKAAAIGFVRAAAREGGRYNIRVNGVAPGFVDTDMIAGLHDEQREGLVKETVVGRLGQPEEIAKAVRYIVTDGDWMTGEILNLNGGMFIG